ncbi:HNH endonuclease [Paenibacillus glycanilyticus]|uniref:HNH endonuclease n=1 Tax=Paenibacillus glycanilyticus TaxID=126569 RepID=UPI0019112013|nr:HNH endonuclease [Paenibacillus glycanilyticus]
MAKAWARKLYNSKEWKACRASYIESVHGLCERCGEAGYIVHHTIYLTPQNINDPEISLNHELLEYLCLTCHNGEHMGNHEPITAQGTQFDAEGNLILVGRGFERK